MKIDILLEDRLQVQTPKVLRNHKLSDAQREKLLDSFFSNPDESKRGLYVTFDLSHSGKLINNRIYQPWAQAAGIPTWTEPVGLPIIKNHNQDADPVGRFVSVKWVPLEAEARALLGDSGYNEVAEAYNSRDAKEIGRVMNKYKLVDNPKWEGLGKLEATAVINDREDIEKFIDGRHMSFSAGGKTNKAQCSKCGHNLRPFDMCEHQPGVPTEDGDFPFVVTNTYNGREGSITPFPADRSAIVRHMTFDPSAVQDSEEKPALSVVFSTVSDGHFFDTCDSEIVDLDLSLLEDETTQVEDDKGTQATQAQATEDDADLDPKVCDDADADWFTLDLALQSLVGVQLTEDQRAALDEKVFCGPDRTFPIADKAHLQAAKTLLGRYKGAGDKAKILAFVEKKAMLLGLDDTPVEEVQKLVSALSDANKLAQELRSQCEAEKAKAETAVAQLVAKDAEIAALTQSLAEALKDREATADSLESVLDFLVKDKKAEVSLEDSTNRLDVLLGWFDTIVSDAQSTQIVKLNLTPHPDDIELVNDPSLEDEEPLKKVPVAKLGTFDKNIVMKYHELLNDYNETSANQWLFKLKSDGIVSADFDPTQYELNSKE